MRAKRKPSERRGCRVDLDVVGERFAVIYTRVSDTDEGNNEDSHEYQEKACRQRAEALGYTVVEVFQDNFSGRYLYERPGLCALRERVRQGGLHAVFVWKLDRFSRSSLAQRAIVVQELRQHGCSHISATEAIADTAEGRLLEAVLGAIAEFEVERTLERSQATLSLLRDRGAIICQGLARYGYRYVTETRTREIVEVEAQWVRKIFEWYLQLDSADVIAARLTSLRVPTPAVQRGVKLKREGDRQWYSSTVRAILKDESYTGAPMVSGKRRSTTEIDRRGNAVMERTPESAWWTSSCPTPVLVSRADFDQVQAILAGRRTHFKTRNGLKPYLMRGRMTCGVCGLAMSPMTTTTAKGGKYLYFACISTQLKRRCGNKPTPMKWLDEAVWDKVVEFLSDGNLIEQRFAELAAVNRVDELERDLLAHQGAMATARQSVRRLVERLEHTDDPEFVQPIEQRLAELKGVIVGHQSEVTILESRIRVFQNQEASIRRAKEASAVGRARLREGMSFEEQTDLLEAFNVQVVAKKKELTIHMGLPFVNNDNHPSIELPIHQQWLSFEFTLCA